MSARKQLWRAAMGTGNFSEWREACERAVREGWTLSQVNRILDLAFLSKIGIAIGIFAATYGIFGLLFGWPK